MTLNAVIALILRFFHRIRQIFRPITVVDNRPIMSVKFCLPVPVFYFWRKLIRTLQRGFSAMPEHLVDRLGMLTNTAIILYGHFHDLLGLPVPPSNFLQIAVVVLFLGSMPIPFTSPQCQNNENR